MNDAFIYSVYGVITYDGLVCTISVIDGGVCTSMTLDNDQYMASLGNNTSATTKLFIIYYISQTTVILSYSYVCFVVYLLFT